MIDFAKITVKAGDGGRGSGSFHKIKGKRYGKADGGDGGKGGNIYFVVSRDLNTLEPFRFIKHYQAENGQAGASRKRKGAQGGDLEVKVPIGTVTRISAGPVSSFLPASAQPSKPSESSQSSKPLDLRAVGNPSTAATRYADYDLAFENQRVLIARGGDGGRGNAHLRDEFGRRPKKGEVGELGEEVNLTLELKLIADVGLIGLPNAGKSTLLSALTSAKPEIASYPFTTLEPNLGVMSASSIQRIASSEKNKKLNANPLNAQRSIVIADIPGLIEGASQGKGLGDLFLRHIERTKILVHLIDLSTSVDPWKDYQTIRNELKTYSKELSKKKEIVLLNKVDICDDSKVTSWLDFFRSKKKKVFAVSAQGKLGLEEFIKILI